MDVTVGKKKFRLVDVSIYITELYSELSNMAYEIADAGSDIDEIQLEYEIEFEEAETIADKKRAKLKKMRAIKGIKAEAATVTERIFAKRFEILEEILTLNGYEYDYELWHKHASVEQVNDILVELVGGGSKKKAVNPISA